MHLLKHKGKISMATQKIWILKYVAGNPAIFSKVTTVASGLMRRSEALTGAQTIDANGGCQGWRIWVEHAESGRRIFESVAEKQFAAAQT
jgi:hypothetical protein